MDGDDMDRLQNQMATMHDANANLQNHAAQSRGPEAIEGNEAAEGQGDRHTMEDDDDDDDEMSESEWFWLRGNSDIGLPVLCYDDMETAQRNASERRWSLWGIGDEEYGGTAEDFSKTVTSLDDHPGVRQQGPDLNESMPLRSVQDDDDDDAEDHLVRKFGLRIPGVQWLLLGTRDPKSSLAVLRGHDAVLQMIATRLAELHRSDFVDTDGVFAVRVNAVEFPEPNNRYCNMMPIKLGDVNSIPDEFKPYIPMIAACPVAREEWYRTAYLTVDERRVDKGFAHRRPGLHVEAPIIMPPPPSGDDDKDDDDKNSQFFVSRWRPYDKSEGCMLDWGRGYCFAWPVSKPVDDLQADGDSDDDDDDDDGSDGETYWEYARGHLCGGIFMASNVPDSTRVFNCQPKDTAAPFRLEHGDIDPLRPFMPRGAVLKDGDLVWITDQTPHESLVLPESTDRQFFRLVTRRIDVWYADHSTPNPCGFDLPDDVIVVHGDKFDPKTSSDLYQRLQQRPRRIWRDQK